ncbi:hypothetical protein CR513_28505, partial [Mucuna pruriens]
MTFKVQVVSRSRYSRIIETIINKGQQCFKGWSASKEVGYDQWIREVENIFCIMECTDAQKVTSVPMSWLRKLSIGERTLALA